MTSAIEDYQGLCGILRVIFEDPNLIISAGCLRDTLSNVPVKDIDVFTESYETEGLNSKWATQCKTFAEFCKGVALFRVPSPEYPTIFDICDVVSEQYGIVQIIAIQKDPIYDVPNYDFGLSQVFVTPNGLFFSEAAVKDRENKTITFAPSDLSEKAMIRSRDRFNRLKEKYHGWTFVNCEELEAMNNATK